MYTFFKHSHSHSRIFGSFLAVAVGIMGCGSDSPPEQKINP
jgi:hypothetical protein